MPTFWRVVFFFLIINVDSLLSKAFSASIEMFMWFFFMWFLFFNLLIWCVTLINFAYIEDSVHPWDKFQFIMVYDPFNVLLDSIC